MYGTLTNNTMMSNSYTGTSGNGYSYISLYTYSIQKYVFTTQCTLVQMRGIGIACRPSVCPSVTLVDCDHIGWKSWKLITRATSPTPSLFVAKRRSA